MDLTELHTPCDVCNRKYAITVSYKFKRIDGRIVLCARCAMISDIVSIPDYIPSQQIKKYFIERIKDGKKEVDKHSKQESKSQRVAEMGSLQNFRDHWD